MATQVTAFPQAQVISAEVLQHIFSICDSVADDLRNGAQIRAIPVTSVFPQGGQVVEVLKGRLEAITNVRFEIFANTVAGIVLYPVAESMSPGPSVASADRNIGFNADESSASASTHSAKDATLTHLKKNVEKTPRPKNAFMIYRLDFHAIVAAQNPGMHNNDISKIIGANWRSEKPHIVEEYKRRAEEEKRQHAIAHPGYRYQPRKPSEKKKRMTKNKLAKLAAKASSIKATTDATTLPAQVDANNQLYNMVDDEQVLNFGDDDLDMSPLGDPWALFDSQLQQPQADAGMFAQQDLFAMGSGFAPPASMEHITGPTTARESFVEQHRHEQLDHDFTFSELIHENLLGDFPPGDGSGPISDDFSAAESFFFNGGQL